MQISRQKRVVLALLVLLAGCTAPGLSPATTTPMLTPSSPPIHQVPEALFMAAAEPQPQGDVALSGLYGHYGPLDKGLEVCSLATGALRCLRYFVTLDSEGPALVQVQGRVAGRKLFVDDWQPLAWDRAASQAAALAGLREQADALAALDWAAIARPDFAQSSAQFQWPAHRIAVAPLELHGYDTASQRIIWRIQGQEMPPQKDLVHRFPALYLLTDPAGQQPVEIFVTIEGYVEE